MPQICKVTDPNTYFDKLYIVLINWNSWADTLECLESIFRSDYPNFQIVLVDNASEDFSIDRICSWCHGDLCLLPPFEQRMQQYSHPPLGAHFSYLLYQSREESIRQCHTEMPLSQDAVAPIVIIRSGGNLGFGGGNNVALSYIMAKGDGDKIWLLNNDTVVERTSISQMMASARITPGVIGSVVRFYSHPESIQSYGGGFIGKWTARVRPALSLASKPLDYVFGASLMMDRDTIGRVGLFDEKIFMYFEEIEYCIRAKANGVAMNASPAVVYHKGGASSQDRFFQWQNVYQNKVYTLLKHHGFGLWALYSLAAWLLNLVDPRVSRERKRASWSACRFLVQAVLKHWRNTSRFKSFIQVRATGRSL